MGEQRETNLRPPLCIALLVSVLFTCYFAQELGLLCYSSSALPSFIGKADSPTSLPEFSCVLFSLRCNPGLWPAVRGLGTGPCLPLAIEALAFWLLTFGSPLSSGCLNLPSCRNWTPYPEGSTLLGLGELRHTTVTCSRINTQWGLFTTQAAAEQVISSPSP